MRSFCAARGADASKGAYRLAMNGPARDIIEQCAARATEIPRPRFSIYEISSGIEAFVTRDSPRSRKTGSFYDRAVHHAGFRSPEECGVVITGYCIKTIGTGKYRIVPCLCPASSRVESIQPLGSVSGNTMDDTLGIIDPLSPKVCSLTLSTVVLMAHRLPSRE